MTTIQVQVRLPENLVNVIDKWVKEGKFSSRSEAVKTIVNIYEEREKTRKFYQLLHKRSEETKKNPDLLVPLDEIS